LSEIIERQRAFIRDRNLDALISISPENVAYTAGFFVPSQLNVRHRHAICLITANGSDVMICVDMEAEFVRSQATFADIRVYREFRDLPMDLLAAAIWELGLSRGRIAIELDYLPARDYLHLQAQLPNATWIDADARRYFWDMRMVKTIGEIAAIRDIGEISEQVHHLAFAQIHAGMTEKDLERIIVSELYAAGIDRICLIIVGSGERSGYPNCSATDRVLRPGDLIRVDILAIKGNYMSDCARTAVVGRPNPEQQRYWQMMVDTRRLALEMVRPGVHTDDIYRAYREAFEGYGLPVASFLGHGLGLSTHEYPYIGIYGGAVLEEGMVLCVEPFWFGGEQGIGFQLEDEVIVTRDGYDLITNLKPTDNLIEVH
jgi:Xaa-Pro aminopeptidase